MIKFLVTGITVAKAKEDLTNHFTKDCFILGKDGAVEVTVHDEDGPYMNSIGASIIEDPADIEKIQQSRAHIFLAPTIRPEQVACAKCKKIIKGYHLAALNLADYSMCYECSGIEVTDKSTAIIKFRRVQILDTIKLPKGFYHPKINELTIKQLETDSNTVIVYVEIDHHNIDDNYMIACGLKDFLFNIFYIVSINVEFLSIEISPKPTIGIMDGLYPGMPITDNLRDQGFSPLTEKGILKIDSVIKKKISNLPNALTIMHFSQKTNNTIERFRNLFGVFEDLTTNAGCRNGTSIDYKALLQQDDISKILTFHIGQNLNFVQDFIKSDLKDERANKNWSFELKKAFDDKNNAALNFSFLKCIQAIRNNLVHGSLDKIDPNIILIAYRMLYPVVQQMFLGI